MYNVSKSVSRKNSSNAVALQPRVPRCVSEIHAARYRFSPATCCRDPPNEKRCCAFTVAAESRRGRVNAGMRDRVQTYECAGESAKELGLHLCGKTHERAPRKGSIRGAQLWPHLS